MRATYLALLSLWIISTPEGLSAGQPTLMLEDGGIQFPDGTVLDSAAAVDPPATVTVAVDCGIGESINDALETPADDLTIQITGICSENVVVKRDNVSLLGSNKTTDGIHGVTTGGTPEPAVLEIFRSSNVTIKNLTIANGGNDGIWAQGSRVLMDHVTVTGNADWGLTGTLAARFDSDNITVSSNDGGGVALTRGTTMVFRTSVVSGNGTNEAAVLSLAASYAYFIDSTISGDRGVEVVMTGFAYLEDTSVSATGVALSSFEQGDINVYGRDGTVQISGAIQADWKAFIWAANFNQTDSTVGNKLSRDSTLSIANSTLLGMELEIFSNGDALDSSVGDVTCFAGSDLYCHGTTATVGTSTCTLCPAAP